MVQFLQSNLSEISIGANEILTTVPGSSNRQFPVRSSTHAIKKLEAELNEHRYYLERKVEQRTEQLVKCIKLLESCNTTLCEKLAQAKRDIAVLQKQIDSNLTGTEFNGSSRLSTCFSKRTQNQAEPEGRMAA